MKPTSYGIDFGTTNTSVAVYDGAKKMVIPLDPYSASPEILRSVIYVTTEGKFLFGQQAVTRYNQDVANQEAAYKKTIHTGNYIKITSEASPTSGYKPDQIVEEVYEAEVTNVGRLLQGIKSLLGSKLISQVTIFDKRYSIEELIATYLAEVRSRANHYLQEEIDTAVIGRPVEFVGGNNLLAAARLKEAASQAGFRKVKLQLEPVGAAFDFRDSDQHQQTVLVFDFGGGTLDLSLVRFPQQEVVVNTGIPLGGDLINSRIFSQRIATYFAKGATYGHSRLTMPDHIYRQLQHWYSISLLKNDDFAKSLENYSYQNTNPQGLLNLEDLVFKNLGFSLYEQLDSNKKELSSQEETLFRFQLPRDLITESISREEFEHILAHDLDSIRNLVDETLQQAEVKAEEVDLVTMTGGSSLIPAVQDILKQKFGEQKLTSKSTFTSVASGLAVLASN